MSTRLCLLALGFAFAACGGGGGGGDSPAPAPLAPRISSVTVNGIEAAPRVTVCSGSAYPIKASFANPSRNIDSLSREGSTPDGTRTGDTVDLEADTAWYSWTGQPVLPAGVASLTIATKLTLWDSLGRGDSYTFDISVVACP